jgi:chromosome segregation ATPase
LFLVFGTHAPGYVKTAFHKVRRDIKSNVPMPFDIERTREEIANLEPAIRDNIEMLARAEVEVERLDKEIASIQANMAAEKTAINKLRDSLETGEYRLAGHPSVAYTEQEVKTDLGRRFDSYKNAQKILEAKESTLKAKQNEIIAFRQKLETTMAEKKKLTIKLDEIEARLRQIEATQAGSEFQLDGSALSHAKESVADLEKRLEVMARSTDMYSRYAETGVPVQLDPTRDVVKEIDAEFGPAAPKADAKTGGKSL